MVPTIDPKTPPRSISATRRALRSDALGQTEVDQIASFQVHLRHTARAFDHDEVIA